MEVYSSDGSWSVNEINSLDLEKIDFGMTLFDGGVTWDVDDMCDQFETSESFKSTREKTKFDPMYRQRPNKIEHLKKEMAAQIKHLQEENDRLNAENTCLKGTTRMFSSFSRLLTSSFQVHPKTIPKSVDELTKLSEHLSAFNPISNGDAAAAITDILIKLEADDESKVKFSDFTGLDGERKKVGKYSVPLSLHSIAKNIIDIYGDVSATGKMNMCASEPIYIMFCASVKEMSDLRLEQVTEDRLLKWRDAIKDALRINFKVYFAMEHLKKIACAYIGLMECLKLENVALRMFNFMDSAEEFNDKPVSSGEQPIIDCESVTGGDDLDGVCRPPAGKKRQLTASQDEFLEMSFAVENKLEEKRKLQLTMALERMTEGKMQMEESLRDAEVALQEKVKELEMLKRKKRSLLAMEDDKKKVIDDFMLLIEAIEENHMKNAQNFDEKAMMDTLLTVMNEGGGVVDNSGNTSAAHVDQGEPRRSTHMKMPSKICRDCDGNNVSRGITVFGMRHCK